jgi:hypothetical protein
MTLGGFVVSVWFSWQIVYMVARKPFNVIQSSDQVQPDYQVP